MSAAKRILVAVSAVIVTVTGASIATQALAHRFHDQAVLGPRIDFLGASFYPPFAIVEWSARWSHAYPAAFALPKLVLGIAVVASGAIVLLGLRIETPPSRGFGRDAWGKRSDVVAAQLLAPAGAIVGRFNGEILAYDGVHHLLLTGGTRSGKTRGSVVPTILATPHSVLVLDLKSELYGGDARVNFAGTAGWRARLGPVFRFAPTEQNSDRLNLLDTVRPGAQEVRDVQNLVELIADPYGDGRYVDFWDRAAKQVLTGVILHVLYTEPADRKTLARVFELLARLDDTVLAMQSTLHCVDDGAGAAHVHPEVERAAHSYAAYHDKLRGGIKATAESYLGLFADPLVRHNTARSTFAISDLVCGERPATLYLSWPPNDAKRVKPLLRLVFGAVLRILMEHQEYAADGRVKQHRLLLLLDEFPQLGKLDLFEQSMGAMAGYGINAFLITQSLHQIEQAYGRHNTILDNCHIVTSFAATDVDTAEIISKLAGDIYEMRPQETWSGKRQLLGLDHRAVAYREERRPLILASEVRRLGERDELIFVSGAKPLKAKKLRYDEEPVFRSRLLPAANETVHTCIPSAWEHVMPASLAARPAPVAESVGSSPRRDLSDDTAVARRKSPGRNKSASPEAATADLFEATDGSASPAELGSPAEQVAPPTPKKPASPFALRAPSDGSEAS